MAIAKHIELTTDSSVSFEAAIQEGLERASKTVDGIRSAWVKDQQVLVENGRVTTYRVNLKVTFVLQD